MPIKTTIVLNDYAYESARACADAAGQTVAEWINEAVRATARRQRAAAYLAWEASGCDAELDDLAHASTATALGGMEW